MSIYSREIQQRGGTTPTLDCALQPSQVEKKDRKIGIAIALIAIVFIFKAFFRHRESPRKSEVKHNVRHESGSALPRK
jgi:hypothetical protein